MEVGVQCVNCPGGNKWSPSRRFPSPRVQVSSPLPLVTTAVKAVSNRPDYSIRDKKKLIQLADRIETKKVSSPTVPGKQAELIINSQRQDGSNDSRKGFNARVNESSGEPLSLQKVSNSFRRSKLYSSFSPRKRSLQKLAKNDPAKTNIEHLVNYRKSSLSEPVTTTGSECEFTPPTPSFHDSAKLSTAFSSERPQRLQKIPKNRVDGKSRSCQTPEATRDHISTTESPIVYNPSSTDEFSTWRPKTLKNLSQIKSRTEGRKCDDLLIFPRRTWKSDSNEAYLLRNQEIQDGSEFEERIKSHEPLTASLSHESCLVRSKMANARGITKVSSSKNRNKRSRSLPRSFLLSKNVTLPQQKLWVKEDEELDSKRIEGRELTATNCPTPAIEMRLEKRGRPLSLDYDQKKAWMTVQRDMEDTSSPKNTPVQPSIKKLQKQKGGKSLDITHPHLIEQPAAEESQDSSSVGSDSGGGDGASTKSTTPSLFQRFSKTFSLRFGGSGAPWQKTPKNSRLASGSSPDIFMNSVLTPHQYNVSPKRVKAKVDPSSGKIRKAKVSKQREDKCQSGDSGIQLGAAEETETSRKSTYSRFDSRDSVSSSPISMKKLSLVEIPSSTWDSDELEEQEGKDDDAGFVSANEDESERVIQNGNAVAPSGYYHSLPLKYSRQKKAQFLEERKKSVRGNVVMEILSTEQNYVKRLNDIVQGFIYPCRARQDLFCERTVKIIFSNTEDILRLHLKILDSLKECVDEENPAEARIGHIFLDWAEDFDLYSEYCYENPMSNATVRQLTLNREYEEFFEACRRLQLMEKLPLHGFLLRPIQRICQYHLILNELLKHTPVSHDDYKDVESALTTMKDVAMNVNDTQRKFDSLQEIVRIQGSIEGWEGPDLVPGNSTILLKGDVFKIAYGHKPKEAHLILLDKELLICRKDSPKKGSMFLTTRIPLCGTNWVNIGLNEDDPFFGMVQNAWRVFDPVDSQWILLATSSPTEKEKWQTAFQNSCREDQVDIKMSEMAKATAIKLMMSESQLPHALGTTPTFPATSTLPRFRKNRKTSSLTKSDSDAMLIEVGKLRKSSHFPQTQNRRSVGHEEKGPKPSSKFYV